MPDTRPEELIRADRLIKEAKFEEALSLIIDFEAKGTLEPKDQLRILILKGKIYRYTEQYKKTREMGEQAYPISQKLGLIGESIKALYFKSFIDNHNEALEITLEAEKLLNSSMGKSSSDLSPHVADIISRKGWIYGMIGNYDKALNALKQGLEIRENIGIKIDIVISLRVLGRIYLYIGDRSAGLDYAMKSLKLSEELNFHVGIASSLSLVGIAYNYKGNFFQAIDYCKQSLSVKEISTSTKGDTLYFMGVIYGLMGKMDEGINYHKQAVELAEKSGNKGGLAINLLSIGANLAHEGNLEEGIEYLKRSLKLSSKSGNAFVIGMSLMWLVNIFNTKNEREQAKEYLDRLEVFESKTEGKQFTHFYLYAKGDYLKTSGRSRDRVEAESLWRQIIEDKISNPFIYIIAVVRFCSYLLEELYMSNDKEILNELNPLIIRLLNITEKTHSYFILAIAKWLQAKVALIQIKLTEAKRLFTEAQRLAENYNMNELAQKISNEHDNLLEQVNTWNNLKNTNAPMSERINLASIDIVLDRMQGRRELEPLELTNEEPVLLLILAEGGLLLFSYPFAEEWKFDDDLFSGFLNSFNSISDEIFSEGLDRAKFGPYTVLMNSVDVFSICYLFKGPSYFALQKLTEFSERIKDEPLVWQKLEIFYKTNQVLEIKDILPIKSIITETLLSQRTST